MKIVTTKMATVVFTPVEDGNPENPGQYLVLLPGEDQSIIAEYIDPMEGGSRYWYGLVSGKFNTLYPTHWAYFPAVAKIDENLLVQMAGRAKRAPMEQQEGTNNEN